MVIVPTRRTLAPCDFALFPKLKLRLKGRRFEIVCDIEGNCKWYSTALRKKTSTMLLKGGKNDGIAVYVPKGAILKEMAAKID
jgi:hypothetical protein